MISATDLAICLAERPAISTPSSTASLRNFARLPLYWAKRAAAVSFRGSDNALLALLALRCATSLNALTYFARLRVTFRKDAVHISPTA